MSIEVTAEPTLSVSEMFGPTIQGEGRSQGLPVVFLRLGLCNLDCSWCDTPFTWDWTGKNGTVYDRAVELRRTPVSEVVAALDALTDYPCRLVVSGGEPLLQQRRLIPGVIERWAPRPVEIETNGTVTPDDRLAGVQLNCSPKLSNSGIAHDVRIVPDALDKIASMDSTFKFVVSSPDDLREIEELRAGVLQHVAPHRIYLMPEGVTADTIMSRLEWVMDEAAAAGYAVSPRLHALAYGDKRGV